MNKNAVICAIEYVLRNDGCNEIPVTFLYENVKKTRCNFNLTIDKFLTILRELENDGLFESFNYGENDEVSENSLVARSQTHPSVPYGDPILI